MENGRIRDLIDQLDRHVDGADEDAQAELLTVGEAVVEQLIEHAPTLMRGGQLAAVEIIRTLGSRRADGLLISLLGSDHDTVREWSAEALGQLGVEAAVPHLRRLLVTRREAGDPPDWTEASGVRGALTALGARVPTVPDAVRQVSLDTGAFRGSAVPDADLELALASLAAVDQVVMYFQRWRPWKDSWSWVDGESWELDWEQPWRHLVQESQVSAAAAAARRIPEPTFVVTIEWIGPDDWPQPGLNSG